MMHFQPRHAARLHDQRVRSVLPFAFDVPDLHRLEAGCLPHNVTGAHPGKVRIRQRSGGAPLPQDHGMWQDHELFTLLR